MNVENLQRITSLARDFMHYGMASSMDDAVAMAEKHMNGGTPVTDLKNSIGSGTVLLQQPQAAVAAVSAEAESNLAVQVRKLTRSTEEQQKEIDAIRQKMNEMISIINGLEAQVKEARKNRPAEVAPQVHMISQSQQSSAERAPQQEQSQFRAPAQPQHTPQNNARSGKFTPADVSIEKMFYFGGR